MQIPRNSFRVFFSHAKLELFSECVGFPNVKAYKSIFTSPSTDTTMESNNQKEKEFSKSRVGKS